jgi:hypothetical protein
MKSRQFSRIGNWTRIPRYRERALPYYIPEDVHEAYRQACFLTEVSPKASAALARSCLQIMIRDFWSLTRPKQGNLAFELDHISPKLAPETVASIDAVRQAGRIESYLQEDTNCLVDADSEEARLLIALTEVLFVDWYTARRQRQDRSDALKVVVQELDIDLPMKLTKVVNLPKHKVKEDAPAKQDPTA